MDQSIVTLTFCILAELVLISEGIKRYKIKKWDSRMLKSLDYFSIFAGIPICIFTVCRLIYLLIG